MGALGQTTRKPALVTKLVCGALGGAVGAGCMTLVRMIARRRGLIDKTVSQSMEEWVASRTTGGRQDKRPGLHHLADQLMHFGYGVTLGALYGLAIPNRRARATARGSLFGVGTWLFGSWVLLPLLGAKSPPWRKLRKENATDFVAHLLYGIATGIVGEELALQRGRGATSDGARRLTSIG